VLAPQRIRAHPEVIFSNGFDLAHLGPSHGIDAHTDRLDVEPCSSCSGDAVCRGRIRSIIVRSLII
jgi:hypothetical protein